MANQKDRIPTGIDASGETSFEVEGNGIMYKQRTIIRCQEIATSVLVAFVASATTPCNATVIEYRKDGEATVTEHRGDISALIPSQTLAAAADYGELRKLTRAVALRFSGEPGVRKSGLDVLTFIEIFEHLIEAESSFDPNAISEEGAMGLGQLMPGTAADLNVTNPFDPDQNLVGSARYFTTQLLEFGTLELALAAYNAGPERVKEYKGVPPFPETTAYIAKIKSNAGLSSEATRPTTTEPNAVPTDKEQPLTGEQSVWEF